eukprot:1730330-Pleurochrysis_carterae.AAC.6
MRRELRIWLPDEQRAPPTLLRKSRGGTVALQPARQRRGHADGDPRTTKRDVVIHRHQAADLLKIG